MACGVRTLNFVRAWEHTVRAAPKRLRSKTSGRH